MGAKFPKASANYKPMKVIEERCGLCRHYVPEYADQDRDQDDATGCELVAGEIVADYVCKLFEAVDITAEQDDSDAPWVPAITPIDTDLLPASSSSYMSVGKSEGFQIAKTDDDAQLVFGWASISTMPDGAELVDHHNDVIEPAELEKAAYEYVLKFRDAGEMHQGQAVGQLVESLVMTPEKAQAMGIPQPMGTRWWVGYRLNDPGIFAKVKDGTYKMFSIQGTAEPEWDGEEN